MKIVVKEWALAHPDRRKAIIKKSDSKHSERRNAYKKTYEQANRERRREQLQQWRNKNREHYNKQDRDRRKRTYAENPQPTLHSNKRYRARKRGAAINDFTLEQWKTIKQHYKHRCAYCGKKSHDLTQDHITPLSKGGNHTMSNIVPACTSCNSKKKDRPVLAPVQPLLL